MEITSRPTEEKIAKVKAELIEYINNAKTFINSNELIAIVEQESIALSYYGMSDVYEYLESDNKKFYRELSPQDEESFMMAIQRDFPADWEDFSDSVQYVANKMSLEIVDDID